MAARQRQWARNKRQWLYEQLVRVHGSICGICGSELHSDWEFDCKEPRGHFHHRGMDSSWRMSFYLAQWRAGNLQLAHPVCNRSKQDYEDCN